MEPLCTTFPSAGKPIKAWITGVAFDPNTYEQLQQTAEMPFIYRHVAVMPDCHVGIGSTVGSVIPTIGAIIPAAVGVDIGCGMVAARTTLSANDLPESLKSLRDQIETVVPVGFYDWSKQGFDRRSQENYRKYAQKHWVSLSANYKQIMDKYPDMIVKGKDPTAQLGTLGGGNHFIELCLDETQQVWLMLHSGSRGIGNRIGSFFIEMARKEIAQLGLKVPNRDLAFLTENTAAFTDYIFAVEWAQQYAYLNREAMVHNVLEAMRQSALLPPFKVDREVVNCHHNYISREHHFNETVYVTRKGAIRAGLDDYGIIPGSMGARSFIVKGKGHPESFESCSHGAGRVMSRAKAKQSFTLTDHIQATKGVECRKDEGVIDETPAAYKDIDAVMAAQADLVDVVHTLKQVLCVKG